MKILIIGATGTIGSIAARTLAARGHEIVRASRTSPISVDLEDPASIADLFAEHGAVDAVIVASGTVPFKPVTELTREDYTAGFTSKALGQVEVVRHALTHLPEGGSITLTTGVIARSPIASGAAAALANGALESFVITAAAEAPRGIRINAVSPDVLESSPGYHSGFPGHRPVTDEEVGRAYTLAVEGLVTGQTLTV